MWRSIRWSPGRWCRIWRRRRSIASADRMGRGTACSRARNGDDLWNTCSANWCVVRKVSSPNSMTEAESNIPRYPLGHLVLKGWFFAAVFGALWWQFGTTALLIGLAWMAFGLAVSLARRLLPSWQGGEEGIERNEQVLSSDPTEAKTARRRITSNLAVGLGGYTLFVSSILAGFTVVPFWIVLGAVASGMVFTAALFLVWATTCSVSPRSRWSQFRISTLLLLTTISAMYLGVIRLLADLSGGQLGTGDQPFAAVTIACFILTGFSLPFLLIYAEHLVWLAAWFVRRPRIQTWLRR